MLSAPLDISVAYRTLVRTRSTSMSVDGLLSSSVHSSRSPASASNTERPNNSSAESCAGQDALTRAIQSLMTPLCLIRLMVTADNSRGRVQPSVVARTSSARNCSLSEVKRAYLMHCANSALFCSVSASASALVEVSIADSRSPAASRDRARSWYASNSLGSRVSALRK